MKRGWTSAASAAVLVAALCSNAAARGTISEMGITNHAPQAGQRLEVQVALTAGDAAGLRAGAYAVQVEMRTADGAAVATSDPVTGDSDVTPQRAAVLVPVLTIPAGLAGAFTLQAILLENGTATSRSDPQSLQIGALALAAATTQPPAAASGFALDGTLAVNENSSANALGQDSLLTLDGKFDANTSLSASGGITTSNGGDKPLISFRTKQSQTQIGTFAPSFDQSVFDGPSGIALTYRSAPDDKHALQLATLFGARGTLNPYTAIAANAQVPVSANARFGLTAGTFKVAGGATNVTGELQPDNGTFLGLSLTREQGQSVFGYGLRYGFQWFTDKFGNKFASNAIAATANLLTGKAAWAFDYHRGGVNFINLLAPGVTPDRESAHLTVNVPFGTVTTSFGLSSDRDDLASTLIQRNHSVSENFSLNVPFKNGDSLAYSVNGSTTHLWGDPVVAAILGNALATNMASAGDGQNLTYNMKRGIYTFGYTLGYTNQHDNANNTSHATQNGISIARAVATGLNLTANVNLTTNVSGNAASTTSGLAGTLGFGYQMGPVGLTGSIGTNRNRPFFGLRPADSSTVNLGVKIAKYKNFNIQAGFTQATGAGMTSQTGTVNVTQKF